MKVDIRAAEVRDLETLGHMESACFTDPWGRMSLGGQLASAATVSLVAEADGQAVGYLFLGVSVPEAEIYRIGVLPEARRAGVGDALLEAGLARLSDMGVHTLFLDVRAGNEPAQNLYKKHGFSVCGTRQDYYRTPKEDAVLMRREADECCI